MGSGAMSSDEEIEDQRRLHGYAHRFVIIDKPWRSADLKKFLHGLDIVHSTGRSQAGNPIRDRRPENNANVHLAAITVTKSTPSGLPIDCYDDRYLRGLSHLKKTLLSPSKIKVFENFDMSIFFPY